MRASVLRSMRGSLARSRAAAVATFARPAAHMPPVLILSGGWASPTLEHTAVFTAAVRHASAEAAAGGAGASTQDSKAEFGDPTTAGRPMFTPGLLLKAAELDAAASHESVDAYLTRVDDAAAAFFLHLEEDGVPRVINHKTTLNALEALARPSALGTMALLTGPRSVGKSLMLEKSAKALKRRKHHVVIFDARQHGSDLARGIMDHLKKEKSFQKDVIAAVKALALEGVAAFLDSHLPGAGAGVKAAADSAGSKTPELKLDELLGAMIAACNKRRERLIIVIDEANKALAATDPASRARTLDLLDLFTRITKQKREASVVLATSEHGLPFRLRALGYNSDHIRKVIMAEEVPQAEMKDLLMKTWGCGEHLATALLSLYGGHVMYASIAISELATADDRGAFEGSGALTSIMSAPALCLDSDTLATAGVPASEHEAMLERVRKALRQLAVEGFVPLDSNKDKVAEIISLANVGCVIPRGATAASVPTKVWEVPAPSGKTPSHVLVPSSHIMRQLIANEVFPAGTASVVK